MTPDEKLIRQYIQDDDIARDFAAYYQLYAKYRKDYPITELLAGNLSEKEFEFFKKYVLENALHSPHK